jgi:UDP-glucuronate decarboxylase
VETIKEVISKRLIYHLIDYPDGYPQDEPMRRSTDISEAQIQLRFESRIKFNIGLLTFLAWSKDVYSAE